MAPRRPQTPGEEDLMERMIYDGRVVDRNSWGGQGSPGSSFLVTIYLLEGRFGFFHDLDWGGPYDTLEEAVEASGINEADDDPWEEMEDQL